GNPRTGSTRDGPWPFLLRPRPRVACRLLRMPSKTPPAEPLYPLFLRLRGRAVLVAGAGAVAERKIAELVLAGANVHVVAKEATAVVRSLARARKITWSARGLRENDLEGVWLAVAATDDAHAQKLAAKAAEARSVILLAVDDVAR